MVQARACENLNHRRSDAPVRNCPQCGEIVNKQISIMACSEVEHARAKRNRSEYCAHCGLQLIKR